MEPTDEQWRRTALEARAQNADLMAALKLARIPFAASLPRRSDRDEAERELASIDAALAAAGRSQGGVE